MFRSYIVAALRNLARNRLYAGINIVGLAAGFAAAILIALFIRDELSFDRFWPDYQRVYLVVMEMRLQGIALLLERVNNRGSVRQLNNLFH